MINRSISSKRFQYGSHSCRLWEKHSSKHIIICEYWLIWLLTNYATTLTSNFGNVHNYVQIVFNYYTRIFVGRPVAKKTIVSLKCWKLWISRHFELKILSLHNCVYFFPKSDLKEAFFLSVALSKTTLISKGLLFKFTTNKGMSGF